MTSSVAFSEPVDNTKLPEFQLGITQSSEEPSLSTIDTGKLKRSRTGKPISYIWEHAQYSFNERKSDQSNKRLWHCRYCSTSLRTDSGTGKIMDHLFKNHEVGDDTHRVKRQKVTQSTVDSLFHNNYQSKARRTKEAAKAGLDPGVLEQLLVRLITIRSLPYSCLEWAEFRALLRYIHSNVDDLIPYSHHTARDWVVTNYEFEKINIKSQLATALSNIHFTVDAWTSGNNMAILAVVSYYTNEDGFLVYSPLSMKEMTADHSGANMAVIVRDVLDEFEISPENLGYFMMDNAGNNNHLMKHLSQSIFDCHGFNYDPITRRLRCNGHVLNLAAQAILNVKKSRKPRKKQGKIRTRGKKQKEAIPAISTEGEDMDREDTGLPQISSLAKDLASDEDVND